MMSWFGNTMSVRYLGRRDRPRAERPVAERVPAERSAHGDVDEPEYRQRLDVLRGDASSELTR